MYIRDLGGLWGAEEGIWKVYRGSIWDLGGYRGCMRGYKGAILDLGGYGGI